MRALLSLTLIPLLLGGVSAPCAAHEYLAVRGLASSGDRHEVSVGAAARFIGNNFVSRSPSLEYPRASGYEHLPDGGLWVGAQSSDTSGIFIGVTTASLDMSQGASSQSASEFSPSSNGIWVRSDIPSSPFYDPFELHRFGRRQGRLESGEPSAAGRGGAPGEL
ncbi:MAG: hypothetical protein AUI33_01475 [Ignavibacteria bacterium 13_1_40CM_2_61_4]|nr:MAG: hypothetical protein AUI33_01475 [Ignavibacteria bacterium 13_1_40CM_2_61_4]